MDLFHPPGHLDDFARRPQKQEAFARGWDAIVNAGMDLFTGVEGGAFYNPHADGTPGEPDRASIAWDAFPRPVTKWFDGEDDYDTRRWRAAEVLRPRVFGGEPLRRVVDGDLDLVAELYRQHVDPRVAVDDLVWPYDVAAYDDQEQQWYYFGLAGTCNPFNPWNTTSGAMHLTHPANTPAGELRVAARSTRRSAGPSTGWPGRATRCRWPTRSASTWPASTWVRFGGRTASPSTGPGGLTAAAPSAR